MKSDNKTKLDVVALYKSGFGVAKIMKQLNANGKNVTRQFVRYWIGKYESGLFDIGLVPDRNARKHVLAQRDIDVINSVMESDPNVSSRDIHTTLKRDGSTISLATTKRAIETAGYTNSNPRYGQMVSERNCILRTDFCNELISNNDTFSDVIFSDESTIQLHSNKCQSYRPKNSVNKCLPRPKHPLKMHVWAGISRRGPTPITIFDGIMDSTFYTENILRDNLVPFIRQNFPDGHRFQQDNDPKHRSLMAQNFLRENNINYPKWPAQSPDLNPIEMVWHQLKCFVAKMEPRTKEGLIDCIERFWSSVMTVELCNQYIDHLFKVVPVCFRLKGAATGDLPNRLFSESSAGKSITYFENLLTDSEKVRKKAESLNLV